MKFELLKLADWIVKGYEIAILIRVLFSWIRPHQNAFTVFIYEITEPILAPIRRYLPAMAGLDISPIIALVLIDWVYRFLVRLIFF